MFYIDSVSPLCLKAYAHQDTLTRVGRPTSTFFLKAHTKGRRAVKDQQTDKAASGFPFQSSGKFTYVANRKLTSIKKYMYSFAAAAVD